MNTYSDEMGNAAAHFALAAKALRRAIRMDANASVNRTPALDPVYVTPEWVDQKQLSVNIYAAERGAGSVNVVVGTNGGCAVTYREDVFTSQGEADAR